MEVVFNVESDRVPYFNIFKLLRTAMAKFQYFSDSQYSNIIYCKIAPIKIYEESLHITTFLCVSANTVASIHATVLLAYTTRMKIMYKYDSWNIAQ